MKTNFFESIQTLRSKSDWKISIKWNETGQLIVSVLLSKDDIGDQASKLVPPMIFKGTPKELDEGFFDALENPARQTELLFANMKQFTEELQKARENSKIEEENNRKQRTEKDDKKKRYDAQMKKVIELEEKEKWGEAIGAMPKADIFPDQADEIKKKLEDLRKKHGNLELFS